MNDLPDLVDLVQRNCHIADARHARDMTMCTYLLEMREYYRWEQGLPRGVPPPRAEVGRWLSEREALWESLMDEPYADLPVGGTLHPPFAVADVNRALVPAGLLYGAGYGRGAKPHFFLADLLSDEVRDGVRVSICGCEHARDIAAIPAALQGDAVIVRQEALRQWLWEKIEAWEMKRNDGPMQAALTGYGRRDGAPVEASVVERMAAAETETVILHELGEHAAGRIVGPDWEAMLAGIGDRPSELLLRAVRDHLADCLVTLPTLIDRRAEASLHFWFANLDGFRHQLFPLLADAYPAWRDRRDAACLAGAIAAGREHWQAQALRLLDLWRERGAAGAVETLRGGPDAFAL